jgi:hypothetical protein
MDLVGLVEELKRQKMNSLDIIAEDEHIYAIPDENYGLVLGVYKTGKWPPVGFIPKWVRVRRMKQ